MIRYVATIALAATPLLAQDAARFSDPVWVKAGDSTRIETVGGREAVSLYTGSVTRRDLRLQDGTIDVDVMMTRRRSFIYVNFRSEDDENREEFYIRAHKSDAPDAIQYAPVYRGSSAWQLYHGPLGSAPVHFEPGVWTRVRIVTQGQRAAFFVGDTVKPVLVARLAREPRAGYVSLSAFVPAGTPGTGAVARFSNFRARPGVIAYRFADSDGLASPNPAGVITRWSVGPSFLPKTLEPTTLDAVWTRTMRTVAIEPNGMVELNRWVENPAGLDTSRTGDAGVVARVRITAEQAGVRALQLGFSDAATVFLNGQPLFRGDQSYLYAQRRDGLIGFDQATIYLPLRAGANDLAIVVTDHFGGWGIMGRLPDQRGLKVEPW